MTAMGMGMGIAAMVALLAAVVVQHVAATATVVAVHPQAAATISELIAVLAASPPSAAARVAIDPSGSVTLEGHWTCGAAAVATLNVSDPILGSLVRDYTFVYDPVVDAAAPVFAPLAVAVRPSQLSLSISISRSLDLYLPSPS